MDKAFSIIFLLFWLVIPSFHPSVCLCTYLSVTLFASACLSRLQKCVLWNFFFVRYLCLLDVDGYKKMFKDLQILHLVWYFYKINNIKKNMKIILQVKKPWIVVSLERVKNYFKKHSQLQSFSLYQECWGRFTLQSRPNEHVLRYAEGQRWSYFYLDWPVVQVWAGNQRAWFP